MSTIKTEIKKLKRFVSDVNYDRLEMSIIVSDKLLIILVLSDILKNIPEEYEDEVSRIILPICKLHFKD